MSCSVLVDNEFLLKADVESVNKALKDIHKELDTKASLEDITSIVSDQAVTNESLCSENILGRWAWKSGELRSGTLVPWEIQVANTLPDNFMWEKDKTSVLVVAPGLYQLCCGFYSRKGAALQILVNGETLFSQENSK